MYAMGTIDIESSAGACAAAAVGANVSTIVLDAPACKVKLKAQYST